jgi:hypothetical protein
MAPIIRRACFRSGRQRASATGLSGTLFSVIDETGVKAFWSDDWIV